MGHEPVTVDYVGHRPSFLIVLLSGCKTMLLRCIGKKRPFLKRNIRNRSNSTFVKKYINTTRIVTYYDKSIVEEVGAKAVIVGSDQVWRVACNNDTLDDMYLKFLGDIPIKRIAYAASFGVEYMQDYSQKQICEYANLLKKFDVITVREVSGIELCKRYFKVTAEQVLDPTLLLRKEEYMKLCACIPIDRRRILAAYILDKSAEVRKKVESIAREKGLKIIYFSADADAVLSIEKWLSMFRDSEHVVTDSFHGTIFSIIFNKKVTVLSNESRGNARLESLLTLFNIDKNTNQEIDWSQINKIRREQADLSLRILSNALFDDKTNSV